MLCLIAHSHLKHPQLLTMKRSLITAARNHELPADFDGLREGAVLHGWVRSVEPFGLFIHFGNDVCGVANKSVCCIVLLQTHTHKAQPHKCMHTVIFCVLEAGDERLTHLTEHDYRLRILHRICTTTPIRPSTRRSRRASRCAPLCSASTPPTSARRSR